MYIGAVEFPYIKSIKKNANKDVKMVWGAGLSHPVPYEALPGVNEVTIDGTLVSNSTYTKSLANQVEDLLSLKFSDVSQNSIISTDINGYLSVKSVTPAVDADKVGLREVSIVGDLYPQNTYQRRYVSSSVILNNDFSLTLGSDGCENYIAIPKGATYSGGDEAAITRTTADGSITLVKATTSNDIDFDLTVDEVDVGECKVWDTVTAGDTTTSNWVRIFDADHEFSGDIVIDNGMQRFNLNQINTSKNWIFDGTNWQTAFWKLRYSDVPGYSNYDLSINDIISKITSISLDKITAIIDTTHTGTKEPVKLLWTMDRTKTVVTVKENELTSGILQLHYYVYGMDYAYEGTSNIVNDVYFNSNTLSKKEYGISIDTSKNVIAILGYNKTTSGLSVCCNPFSYIYIDNILAVTGNSIILSSIPFSSTSNLHKECEAMTQGSGVSYYTGADASPTTGNTGSILNAQNENVSYTLTGGTTLPLGTYKLFVRAKDSSTVANDLGVTVHNDTDSTDVMTPTTQTLTTSWAYYGFDVTFASDDDGDTITVKLNKETATANTIDLDYVLWIPITSSDGNFPQDVAHQALVDQNLRRELVLR